ncbi:hypothetical protein NDU88_010829 [Pleurodeles waltl]|uniref:Uncharacterized protein n=1 Tax=Pleurodeles waltl TaxID=8319 RepID=A0AAV7S4I2_PLEWA|nr:hypothetical protein NDU88_010829 [Pleurodeles waltl]
MGGGRTPRATIKSKNVPCSQLSAETGAKYKHALRPARQQAHGLQDWREGAVQCQRPLLLHAPRKRKVGHRKKTHTYRTPPSPQRAQCA